MSSTEDLPLPDFDHLPLPQLTSRVRTLDAAGVQALLDHEQAHGDRLPVLEVLRERLSQLQQGAQPSGGAPDAPVPGAAPPPGAGSSASPATSGPPTNPPSHGDPTNPAQPRSTG
jgi:hypothetical protein